MDEMPYLPMVNAIAPNAPTGAKFISIATMRNTGADNSCNKLVIGRALSPTIASDTPNKIDTNKTCKILPFTNGLTTVSGIIFIKKPTTELSFALST